MLNCSSFNQTFYKLTFSLSLPLPPVSVFHCLHEFILFQLYPLALKIYFLIFLFFFNFLPLFSFQPYCLIEFTCAPLLFFLLKDEGFLQDCLHLCLILFNVSLFFLVTLFGILGFFSAFLRCIISCVIIYQI